MPDGPIYGIDPGLRFGIGVRCVDRPFAGVEINRFSNKTRIVADGFMLKNQSRDDA